MISVEWNEGAFRRFYSDLTERQIPFAMALALTRTARDARERLVAELDSTFTIRSKWVPKGMRFEKATKTNLRAEVGSTRAFMALQARGGTKSSGSRRVPVPMRALRKSPKTKITRGKWPEKLLAKPKHFVKPLSAGGAYGLFRVRGGKRNPRLELLHVLAKSAKIPARWPFEKTVEEAVGERWQPNARAALRKAMESARRRR